MNENEQVLVDGRLISLEEAIHGQHAIDWPEGVTPKARQLLERRFTVGRVTTEDCAPDDEPFIGCVARDYEGLGNSATLLTSARDIINELADADVLVGVRQPLQLHRQGAALVFSMRLMVRPDTASVLLDKSIAEGRGVSPYMEAQALVERRTVVSPPGAAVEVTQLKLTPEAQRALQVPAGAFGPAAKPDPKPISWWRIALGWLAFNTYVFTGSRHAHMLMEWAMGGKMEPLPDGGA